MPCFQLYRVYPACTEKAGYSHIPVISLNLSGLESNPGFKITPLLALRGLYGVVFGDIFMKCVYRMRPYEKVPGTTDALHEKWKRDVKILYPTDILTAIHLKNCAVR